MATIKRFAHQAGFSSTVAGQLAFFRRKSTRMNYQARWSTYGKWCGEFGHRSSSPSISKIAEFFTYLFKRNGAALSTVKGYRAMLSAVFKFPFRRSLPLLSLTTSFGLLRFLLPGLAQEGLVLLAMVMDERVSELQALSFSVSFQGEDLVLHY